VWKIVNPCRTLLSIESCKASTWVYNFPREARFHLNLQLSTRIEVPHGFTFRTKQCNSQLQVRSVSRICVHLSLEYVTYIIDKYAYMCETERVLCLSSCYWIVPFIGGGGTHWLDSIKRVCAHLSIVHVTYTIIKCVHMCFMESSHYTHTCILQR